MGGVNDMAAWTTLAWDNNMAMAVNGTESCVFHTSPMEIVCNQGDIKHANDLGDYPMEKVREIKKASFENLRTNLGIDDLMSFARETVATSKTKMGVYLSGSKMSPRNIQ